MSDKPLPKPELPQALHADLDSMLSRKFGKEVANYFSGSPLNRVSFLRTDNQFLSAAIHHPTTRFVLFKNLCPLTKEHKLAYTELNDVKGLTGSDPFGKTEEQVIEEYDSTVATPQMIFLGLDERDSNGLVWKEVYKGAPRFALDVTPKDSYEEEANKVLKEMESRGLHFDESRMILTLPADEGAIYAQARSMLDWNARNPFCAGCGQPTLSVNAGGKRACPPKDAARLKGVVGSTTEQKGETSADRPSCATRKGISNLSFPRTDPTVIMAVVSSDGQKMLIGRQNRFPPGFYSTLAGFAEPGESIEEAVRREVWEEAGVKVGRVVIHSTQPWPYPANLMIGALGQTIPEAETIDLGNDPELEDAKWISLEELREALEIGAGDLGGPPPEGYKGGVRLPPPTAIANQLMRSIATGFLAGDAKM